VNDTDAKPEDQNDDIDAEIIEAEVVEEPTPAPEEPVRPAVTTAPAPKKSFMARAGWILAFGLAAFIGGVAAAPQFDAGLIKLGLKDAPATPAAAGQQDNAKLEAVEASLGEIKASLARQQEMLAQHEAALKAAGDARAKLKDDLTTLASRAQTATESPAPAADAQEIKALQDKVTQLGDDIARLSTLANSTDPEVKDLSGALAIARAESAQLKNRLATLEKAMQSVQSGAVDASPRGRLILALGRLKDRALSGLPFGQDLSALRPDFATLSALDQQRIGADLGLLEDHGGGIPSFDRLLADYDSAATAAVKAADKASGNFLTGLFTMRRTDAGATGLDATLAKAERALRARDVAGAVKLLGTVTGPAADALTTWLNGAKAYVDVEAAFGRLTTTVARDDAPAQQAPAPAPTAPAQTENNEGAAS